MQEQKEKRVKARVGYSDYVLKSDRSSKTIGCPRSSSLEFIAYDRKEENYIIGTKENGSLFASPYDSLREAYRDDFFSGVQSEEIRFIERCFFNKNR